MPRASKAVVRQLEPEPQQAGRVQEQELELVQAAEAPVQAVAAVAAPAVARTDP